jgi:hypothetical protein
MLLHVVSRAFSIDLTFLDIFNNYEFIFNKAGYAQ